MYDQNDNAVNTQARESRGLYERFKRKAADQSVPVKTALREAMYLWLRHEMRDKEFSRYEVLLFDYSNMKAAIRKLPDADDLEELEEMIDDIIREY